MFGEKLYLMLTAAEAIIVGRERAFKLNARGWKVLNYLRARRRRSFTIGYAALSPAKQAP